MIKTVYIILVTCLINVSISAQVIGKSKTPLMGWASWNQFGVRLDEEVIKRQTDAMVSSGLADAGFNYINIDDGFFNGRDDKGNFRIDSTKFPHGMKALVDYIHSKGLKAGFYTEAGENTCGSQYSGQPGGVGGGMYHHDQQDADLFFKTWGFDFLKVDYCGGLKDKLDEKTRYTEIRNAIDNTGRSNIAYNVCRWQFPGTWVTKIADSWRISNDINFTPGSVPKWKSIVSIINQSKYLAPYASPGHYNDMDMLEVGRGLSTQEDKSHFSMWCILSSPLVLGNDLTKLNAQTKEILTNEEVLAVSQNSAGFQAHLLWEKDGLQVWTKNLKGQQSKERAVALLNTNSTEATMSVKWADLNIVGKANVRDLWSHTDLGLMDSIFTVNVPAHGISLVKVTAEKVWLKDVFEAEYSWINNFNLMDHTVAIPDQAKVKDDATCSGGAKVAFIGKRADNYIAFQDVYANTSGNYKLILYYLSAENRGATISVNGKDIQLSGLNSGGWSTVATKEVEIKLNKGNNIIRISNTTAWTPDIDKIEINLNKGF